MKAALRRVWAYCREVFVWLFFITANSIALLGLVMLVEEARVYFGHPRFVTEAALKLAGALLAPLALGLVAASIYFEKYIDARGRTPPTTFSIYFTAPVMMLLAAIFLAVGWCREELNPHIVDALGALALGGTMLRLAGHPFTAGKERWRA